MKLLSYFLTMSFLFTGTAQADWIWDLKVSLRKGIGCGAGDCDSATQVPDKIKPKKIALTFDDGPSSIYTPKILEILDKHQIKATFFILGKNVEDNRSLIRTMVEKGHIVGNHSWDHPNFWELDEAKLRHQILDTDAALSNAGLKNEYFRFPNGNSNKYSKDLLKQKNLKYVGWSVDTCDWGFSKNGVLSASNNDICNGTSTQVTNALDYLTKKIKSKGGGIILMHDTKKVTAENLDAIITSLKQDGYEFVLVNDRETFPLLNQQ